jgi:hypothetical protein
MEDEIVGASQKVDVPHLRPAPNLLDEVADLAARIGLQADRDHCLQRQSHCRGVDIGIEAADDTRLHQSPDSAVAGRRCDVELLGQRAVGHSGIGMEQTQDSAVDAVHVDGPKILRQHSAIDRIFRTFFRHPRHCICMSSR